MGRDHSSKTSISDEKNKKQQQNATVMPELGEKLRLMNGSSHHSTESTSSSSRQHRSSSSSSARRHRRSSSRSSSKASHLTEMEDKMERMQPPSDSPSPSPSQESSPITRRSSSRRSGSSNRRSGSSNRRSGSSSRSQSGSSRKRSGRSSTRQRDGSKKSDDALNLPADVDPNLSDEDCTPGAHRVGSFGQVSTLSPASFEHNESTDDQSFSTASRSSGTSSVGAGATIRSSTTSG
ncbi:unnamed protein product, partial [Cylindrotheca closterium]